MDELKPLLENYSALIQRVDAHIENVNTLFPQEIACKEGCDACCRHLSLFPVEAFALARAYVQAAPMQQARILDNLAEPHGDADLPCPLLLEGRCLLYKDRPLICRTHGYPLYIKGEDGEGRVDFCPENFKGAWELPNQILLDLDQLNTTLLAVNQHFLSAIETDPPMADRIPMSEALLLLSEV